MSFGISTLTPASARGIIGKPIDDGVAVNGTPGGTSNDYRNRFSDNGFGCAMSALMARQLANVSAEVRAVPAPPLPVFPDPYSVRFADPNADAELISDWMNRPHLAETWHYDYPADQWRQHLGIQFQGNYSRPYVISIDGQPMAYMELFRAAQDDVSTLYDADPYDVGLHIAFGEFDMLKRGHGIILFRALVDGVFDVEPQCRRIIGDTHADVNSLGRRAWERRNGAFLGEHFVPKWNQRIALFAWPRTPEDVPIYSAEA
ncbi:GNAT family N-acetyltransferase [Mycolicibacter senuensis]|uniref:Lysine N-acyltransferase MbtK n=1 Tax=Mycolicibacter senuensis TaxID=386913 RepID=A0A7I9XMJ3_9MYCO|nr:GNAT family N-acetyltransferase [Mycolicibacter senuensis]GFG71195.1 siderophore biosynthesis protein [Mycolicibacter senuensis]